MLKTGNHDHHVLGAKNSKHSRSSLVLCERVDHKEISLASISFFVECIARSHQTNGQTLALWLAAVSWYMSHDCAVWFGNPTQVWATTTFPGYNFVPINNIKSRVMYTQTEVNFGRVIGTDKVYVVVPLNN